MTNKTVGFKSGVGAKIDYSPHTETSDVEHTPSPNADSEAIYVEDSADEQYNSMANLNKPQNLTYLMTNLTIVFS